jgi:sugar phosphate isomerase/epimerase
MLQPVCKSAKEYSGMIGVSPAFFISLFTNRFTADDMAAGLKTLAETGYEGFQLEVFHRETLPGWVQQGASLVRRESAERKLKATQFVAHFMIEAFASAETLYSDAGIEEMKSVLDIVDRFQECSIVTVPLGAFVAPRIPTTEDYPRFFDRCAEKIGLLLELVERSSRRMALEILPSAIIGGMDGFMRLCERLGTVTLGFNFDTGHAWASKENLCLIPAKIGKQILGTHLCDNFGNENLSLRPGAGSIDWPRLIETLRASGYEGSFDIEIICRPEETRHEYSKARSYIETLLNS